MNIETLQKLILKPEILEWKQQPGYAEALLGESDDGVKFTTVIQPTCYRRGAYKLLIEVQPGANHYKWGCFDEQDQPVRYYHRIENLKNETEHIARVLILDRIKNENKNYG